MPNKLKQVYAEKAKADSDAFAMYHACRGISFDKNLHRGWSNPNSNMV
jgi:hypothetical protein